MVVWHTFLPFGLSIAICVFISWKSMENQLELRESGGVRRCGDEVEGEDEDAENTSTTTTTTTTIQLGPYTHRPPKTASELRARLQTLSRLPPGPRRRARGRALALAAERALREASPQEPTSERGGGGGAGGGGRTGRGEGDGGAGGGDHVGAGGSSRGHNPSRAAEALRQTLPWLDARLAALASEDAAAERSGSCEICAGHEGARATHAWPCGGGRAGRGGAARREEQRGGGGGGGGGGFLAALFGSSSSSSLTTTNDSSAAVSSSSVYTTSLHRACGRCSAKWGASCPYCRREGAPRLAFLEPS